MTQIMSLAAQQEDDKVSHAGSYMNSVNYQSPLPLPRNPARIPSAEEINDSMSEIEQKFPHLPVDKVISILYKNLIVPKIAASEKALSQVSRRSQSVKSKIEEPYGEPQQEEQNKQQLSLKQIIRQPQVKLEEDNLKDKGRTKKEKRLSTGSMKGENQQNLRKAQGWSKDQNKQYKLYGSKAQTKFSSKEEEVNYHEKRLAAKAFCQRGYGINKLKEEAWDLGESIDLDKKKYKLVSSAFINQSYRRLEQFLIEECGRNIKPLTGPEMRALYAILLNAQTKFEEDDYLTFRKFIKVTYDLGSVSIFEQAAVKLFIKIQICLRGRIGAMKLDRQVGTDFKAKKQMLKSPGRFQNQRLETESIWTAQLQIDLVDAITESKTIARARDILRQKYGDNVVLSNVKELKSRFFKILRIGVKRLQRYAQEYAHKVPLLVHLSDEKIKTIIRCPEALQSRIALGNLYKTTSFNAQILTQTINTINAFCYGYETKNPIGRTREPAIHSVTDKIKHNINVSRKLLKTVTTPAQRAEANGIVETVFVKKKDENYEHIVSLEQRDKLHYFRKTGIPNNKGGYEYEEKPPQLKKLEMEDGDDDSSQLVMLSDED